MIKKLKTKHKIILGVSVAIFIIIAIIGYLYITKQDESTDISLLLLDNDQNISNDGNISNNEKTEVANKENGIVNNTTSNVINNEYNLNNENGVVDEINDEEKIVIHIMGEVKKTGIIYLKQGARIADAIEAAGGATKDADIDAINLAYVLQDGQKINIPNKKDRSKNENSVYITSESGNNVITQESNEAKGGNKKVNINEASQSDLETLPGIGPSIASRIIEYRTQNGKFSKIEDLQNVKGIGDAKYNKIKDMITIK